MALPRISLDETNPDSLYSGAQKINQAIDSLDSHMNDKNNPHQVTAEQVGAETPEGAQAKVDDAMQAHVTAAMPHEAVDPVTGRRYRWGIAVQDGAWGLIVEEVV